MDVCTDRVFRRIEVVERRVPQKAVAVRIALAELRASWGTYHNLIGRLPSFLRWFFRRRTHDFNATTNKYVAELERLLRREGL